MVEFKNGWKSKAKQDDKCVIEIRLGRVSILEIYIDISSRKFVFGILNFFVRN